MVYRHTPLASAMRGYTAGGSRASIGPIDNSKLMQETNNCQGMRGKSWGRMEAPQNYGFTSVTADPDEDEKTGMRKDSAEGMVSFMGGNRSFPVMGPTDDRRHRLFNLAKDAAKGAVAMFGLREWGQQFLNTEDGMHMTGNKEKKIRISLVENKNGKQQQQGQQQQADAGGGRGGATSGGGSRKRRKARRRCTRNRPTLRSSRTARRRHRSMASITRRSAAAATARPIPRIGKNRRRRPPITSTFGSKTTASLTMRWGIGRHRRS